MVERESSVVTGRTPSANRRLDHALDLLQKGEISMGKAAEMAGVTLYDILDQMHIRKIPIGYTAEDLERDLREFALPRRRSD